MLDNLEPQVHRTGTLAVLRQPEGDLRPAATSAIAPCSSRWCSPSQAVVHFGAAVSVGQSMYQVDRYVDVNTRGTALLLDILVNSKHKVEKVIVASSIGVYGEGAYRCATHGAVAPTIRPEQQLAARDWEQHCPSAASTSRRSRRPRTRRSIATTSTR